MIMSLSWWNWGRKHKWLLLLLSIVALLVVSPISEVYDRRDNIITPLTATVLLAVTLGTAERARTIWSLNIVIVIWFITSVLTDGSGLFAGPSVVAPLIFMVLLVAILVLLARWLVQVVFIDLEVLCAAVCGYLLLGILWTGFYALIMREIDSKALVSVSNSPVTVGDLLYFSYTTLTTTGFGDILPRNPIVRMCAVMEAIVGIFYNTIVIARFVGLYGLKPYSPAEREPEAPSN